MKYPQLIAFFVILLFANLNASYCQLRKINGIIYDATTKEPLTGANISWGGNGGTITDEFGRFESKIHRNIQTLTISHLGFFKLQIDISTKNDTNLVIYLKPSLTILSQVEISAERAPIRPEEAVVKTNILNPNYIDKVNATTASDLLERVPGLTVQNGQASIRGGSSFANGVGSRVMLLLDGMPLLSPDLGDIRWNFVPIEAIEQIEVIKGAGSALYGSQAINGIINIKTLQAKEVPFTQIRTWAGTYEQPALPHIRQGGLQNPWQAGASLLYLQKIGDWSLRGNGFFLEDKGYRIGEYSRRLRIGLAADYASKSIEGLTAGINLLGQIDSTGIFYVWQNDTLAYNPFPETTGQEFFRYYMADVYTKLKRNNWQHLIRHRLLEAGNQTNFTEAQTIFNPNIKWAQNTTFSGGIVYQHYSIRAPKLNSTHTAIYFQADQSIRKLRYSIGFRLENYQLGNMVDSFSLDIQKRTISPVVRLGLNYHPHPRHVLWANWGQGFRNPSLVERFAQTEGSGLFISPNPNLLAEKGYSSEIGYRHLYKSRNWQINADITAFIMNFNEMIEFQLQGIIVNSQLRPGFQAKNSGMASIVGFEPSLELIYSFKKHLFRFQGGHTYIEPKSVNALINTKPENAHFLFYRSRHIWRSDLAYRYGRFNISVNTRYNSNIVNYDIILDRINGLDPTDPRLGIEKFRAANPNGFWLHDFQIGYSNPKFWQIQLVCRNITNTAAMVLPGNMANTRTWILRTGINL